MTKREIFQLLGKIVLAYPMKCTEVSQQKVELYYETLQHYEKDCVENMLKRYIAADNKYPPNLSHLIPVMKREQPAHVYTQKLYNWATNAAQPERRATIIEAARKRLKGGMYND
ncbi:replicative helicase loader/inhibitor [Priestia taiwanensis]|uniref:Loader and inhibitor of phage G40P n=1 Tax=Priestia taiwanensis TaxID=1347902 RepID=A0A917AKS1_9BACI|nr:replicative helicase loader/inhibitor [Priestia taiwanensis]MBM7361917.1 uncharacterized membrane-anchored protein YjiN (DUF445 family) [Priestia taiwanensis]GGE57978.1 hypothetical protein GCM10007140_05440 [Priestia taiwanensis]